MPEHYLKVTSKAIPVGNLPASNRLAELEAMENESNARYEHRRLRLQELVAALERAGTKRAWFSTAIKTSDSYVSRLIRGDVSSKHRKNIGDKLMIAITETLGLTPGWFDLPLGSEVPANIKIDKSGKVHRHHDAGPLPLTMRFDEIVEPAVAGAQVTPLEPTSAAALRKLRRDVHSVPADSRRHALMLITMYLEDSRDRPETVANFCALVAAEDPSKRAAM
jgi:hypothetical protein